MNSTNPLDGLQILLVDDDEDSRLLFCTVLSYAGATVTAVRSAIEAIALIETIEPDILVADLRMPTMSGLEMIMQLRMEGWSGPAIAVSACAHKQDVREALESGFDEHLAKPLSITMLVDRIATLLKCVKSENDK